MLWLNRNKLSKKHSFTHFGLIWIGLFFLFFLFCLLVYPSPMPTEKEKISVQAPLFNNLGSFHFSVSTQAPTAQRFFDQGMIFFYGFEWGEAIRSFKEATRLDAHCAMCYWGLALAIGSKVNAPKSGHEYIDAKNAIQKALLLKKNATTPEQAYIDTLALRFQHTPKKSTPPAGAFSCHVSNKNMDVSSKKELSNYIASMKKLIETYPADNNAKALYSYALFELLNWKFWDPNKKIKPVTITLIKTLKSILENDKLHIGGNHYYIHVIEQSPMPKEALESAIILKTLVPGSEHLVHMPSHIFLLMGQYHEASKSNLQAITTFKNYNKICIDQGFKPEINYLYFHNYNFLLYTEAMEGRKENALKAAREMQSLQFSNWLTHDLSLQWFIPIFYFVQSRFGMWDDILKESKPDEKYQYALGMWHYARGLAFAHRDNIKNAENESDELNKIIKLGSIDNNLHKNGNKLLKIADSILQATLADLQNNEQLMLTYLKKADKIQEEMRYHEPPDWYFPIKEALGNAYLKWNHPEEAIKLYQQDLKQYPKNGWALYGLAKALRAIGRTEDADRIDIEFHEAWKSADIPTPILFFSL